MRCLGFSLLVQTKSARPLCLLAWRHLHVKFAWVNAVHKGRLLARLLNGIHVSAAMKQMCPCPCSLGLMGAQGQRHHPGGGPHAPGYPGGPPAGGPHRAKSSAAMAGQAHPGEPRRFLPLPTFLCVFTSLVFALPFVLPGSVVKTETNMSLLATSLPQACRPCRPTCSSTCTPASSTGAASLTLLVQANTTTLPMRPMACLHCLCSSRLPCWCGCQTFLVSGVSCQGGGEGPHLIVCCHEQWVVTATTDMVNRL